MSPRNNSTHGRSTRKSTRGHRQRRVDKIVRFPKKEQPLKRKSSTAVKPPENYESLILYYLAKLRRLFSSADHPTPGNRENSAVKMRKENNGNAGRQEEPPQSINPNRYTARHSSPRPRDNLSEEMKEQAFNIVNAAIEYGYANNVVGRSGNCFYLKGAKSCKSLSLMPVPESRCGCMKCFSRINTNPVEVLKAPAVQNPNGDFVRVTRAMADGSKRYYLPTKQSFRNIPTRTTSCIHPEVTKSGRVNKTCHCSRCRTLYPLRETHAT